MKKAKFLVTRFTNRNGIVSWRVEGRLAGVRIRKNLKTREEAMAERAALEMNSIKATSGLRPAVNVSARHSRGMAAWVAVHLPAFFCDRLLAIAKGTLRPALHR
jgi:hypothetical protein